MGGTKSVMRDSETREEGIGGGFARKINRQNRHADLTIES